jgi:hypothetical protein
VQPRHQRRAFALLEHDAPGLVILRQHIDALPPEARGTSAGPVLHRKNGLRQIVETHAKVSIAPKVNPSLSLFTLRKFGA